jgi:putative flippase GtrA
MKSQSEKKETDFASFLKFSFVGALNTGIDYGLFVLLTTVCSVFYFPAHAISYSAGLVNSYFWNKFWTFRQTRRFSVREAALFVIVNLTAFALAGGILTLCVEVLFFPEALAKAIALPFSLSVNFFGNRHIVFPRKTTMERET